MKKQTNSIFNKMEFNKEPYTTTDKFNVYIPKDQDKLLEIIRKEKENMKHKYRTHSNGCEQIVYKSQTEGNQLEIQEPQQVEQPSKFREKLENQIKEAQCLVEDPSQQQKQVSTECFASPKRFRMKKSNGSVDFLRKTLQYDQTKKNYNKVVEDIFKEENIISQKKDLLNSIYKLKELNLLQQKQPNINRYPGIGKVGFVYNDYHAKSTNSGYSRNFGGVFFTR